MATELPPNYTLQETSSASVDRTGRGPQVVITPLANAVSFQTGNLGAQGEAGTLEGEVQIKGATGNFWNKV
jgi:neural Wiskott-Aldrich syndrome protein